MKITQLATFLTNAGPRNYLFVRLTTDSGLTGVGEASLEWQERAVECLLHDWVEERILGSDPRDVAEIVERLIRDQYQGGPTVLTAISGVEMALWDLTGKACAQPVYQLLGGRSRDRLPAYANGWYARAKSPDDFARQALAVVERGYGALKFDPFAVAWREMSPADMELAEQIVAAVRHAVGDEIELMIEAHGRFSTGCAIEMGRRLIAYRPAWYEEPVTPHSLDQLKEVKQALPFPIAAGERLYMLEEFARMTSMPACDVVQMDLAHCGGLSVGRKIAVLAQASALRLAPHCSIGPVALCAAIHFGWATPGVMIQEDFGNFDVAWRSQLVRGWRLDNRGEFRLPTGVGLGIDIDPAACAAHPPKRDPFPGLWDRDWLNEFSSSEGGN
jgi:galactonate dehydratase